MSVIFRECKSRVRCPNKRTPPSMDDELKSVHFVLNELFREHRLFEDRFDKLEERCQRWIADEQVYLLERIEKLEDENHRLHANYQLEHDRCLETLTDRMLQTLLDRQINRQTSNSARMSNDSRRRFQDLLSQCITPCHDRLSVQDAKKQFHEQQKAIDHAAQMTRDASGTPYGSRMSCQSASDALNRPWLQKRSTIIDEHDRRRTNSPPGLSCNQNPSRFAASTLATGKSKSTKSSAGRTNELYIALTRERSVTPSVLDRRRLPYVNIVPVNGSNQSAKHVCHRRPPPPPIVPTVIYKDRSVQQTRNHLTHGQMPVPRPCRPCPIVHGAPAKTRVISTSSRAGSSSARSSLTSTASTRSRPEPTVVSRIPTIAHPSPRVADLDALIAAQQLARPPSTPTQNPIPRPLFSPNTIRLVRREDLKTFSSELPQDSSDDTSETSTSPLVRSSSCSSKKSVIHRLVFPARLGRLIFYRRILSESDIYQKNCSKETEIEHNVYHLDTIRDYAMEFYMLTTYGSDSQLRAWLDRYDDDDDDDDDEDLRDFDENRFRFVDDTDESSRKMTGSSSNNSDSLTHEDELAWYPELDGYPHTPHNSNAEPRRFSTSTLTRTGSDDASSTSSLLSTLCLIADPFSPRDQSPNKNAISTDEPLTNENAPSLVTDEFQSDFYYLCPMTNTTSFSRIDQPQVFHDV